MNKMFSYKGAWHDNKKDKLIDGTAHTLKGVMLVSWSLTAALYCVGVATLSFVRRTMKGDKKK